MRIYSRKDLILKENNLYLGKEVLIHLQPHPEYENMFYITWPNGDKSEDYYNLTWAIENSYRECLKKLNNTMEDA